MNIPTVTTTTTTCQHPDHFLWHSSGAPVRCPGCGSFLTLVQPSFTVSYPKTAP